MSPRRGTPRPALTALVRTGAALFVIGTALHVTPAGAQETGDGASAIRAVRVAAPIRIDGELDEVLYRSAPSASDFVQALPVEGAPASERTEAWVAFDDENVYVAARVHDSAPERAWVANEMRRDASSLEQNDQFGVFFDTYLDRRNGVGFFVNPLGGFTDLQITNEEDANLDWNPVTEIRTGRFDGGWTVEMAIPFRSLRYRPGQGQVWGIQMRRSIIRKNEWSHLTPLSLSVVGNGTRGSMRVSMYATLEGIEPPPPTSSRLEVKPYGISGLRTELTHDLPIVSLPRTQCPARVGHRAPADAHLSQIRRLTRPKGVS